MPDETAKSFLSSSNVSDRVGKIFSAKRPYSSIGIEVPYYTSVRAVDEGPLGMCIAIYKRPELGPAQDRASSQGNRIMCVTEFCASSRAPTPRASVGRRCLR
jgi:hypothetical protein